MFQKQAIVRLSKSLCPTKMLITYCLSIKVGMIYPCEQTKTPDVVCVTQGNGYITMFDNITPITQIREGC